MRCLIFDLPVYRRVDDPDRKRLDAVLREVGGNTGNLLFHYAIHSHLEDELVPCHWMDGLELARHSSFDGAVLGAANWLNSFHAFSNDKRARVLKELGLPVICIGLGCQHPVTTYERIEFPPETVEFLEVLRRLGAVVLTRDEMTAAQCRHYGLENVDVMGCPSNFINPRADLPDQLQAGLSEGKFGTVVLNSGHFSGGTLELDRLLLPLTEGRKDSYVIQDNFHGVMAMALGRQSEFNPADVRAIKKAFGMSRLFPSGKQAFAALRNQMVAYTDVEEWFAAASGWDLALGSRIHGSMAAIQSGTPAILVACDARTEGLATTMGIPFVPLKSVLDLGRTPGPAEIVGMAKTDFSGYRNIRKSLAALYAGHLARFGLTVSKGLLNLAQDAE